MDCGIGAKRNARLEFGERLRVTISDGAALGIHLKEENGRGPILGGCAIGKGGCHADAMETGHLHAYQVGTHDGCACGHRTQHLFARPIHQRHARRQRPA